MTLSNLYIKVLLKARMVSTERQAPGLEESQGQLPTGSLASVQESRICHVDTQWERDLHAFSGKQGNLNLLTQPYKQTQASHSPSPQGLHFTTTLLLFQIEFFLSWLRGYQ